VVVQKGWTAGETVVNEGGQLAGSRKPGAGGHGPISPGERGAGARRRGVGRKRWARTRSERAARAADRVNARSANWRKSEIRL